MTNGVFKIGTRFFFAINGAVQGSWNTWGAAWKAWKQAMAKN